MRHAILQAFSIRRFSVYAAGQSVSQIGFWTQQVAVSWLAWELTHSEAWLGIVVFCQFVPALIMAPIAGALADRLDRLLLAMVAMGLAAFQATLLWLLSVTGNLGIGALTVSVLLLGTVTSLSLPSMRVVLRYLVPDSLLPAAISINSITLNIARFTGPAIAGMFIYWDALQFCFLINALSYIAIILPLLSFRRAKLISAPAEPQTRTSIGADVREGMVHAWNDPYARLVLGFYLAYSVLGRPAIDLLPAIVARLLDGDGRTLAVLTSAFGIVAVLAGILLADLTTARSLEKAVSASFLLLAIGVIALAWSPSIPWAIGAVVIYGVGQVTVNVCTQTLLQLKTEDHLRGRMMALHFMMFRTGGAFGGLALGALAEWIGLGEALSVAAVGLLGFTLVRWIRQPDPE